MDNVFAQYFFDHFGLSATTAGDLAGSFGMFNIFSRASGGFISDFLGHRYGMRSRLWTHWAVQTLAGVHPPFNSGVVACGRGPKVHLFQQTLAVHHSPLLVNWVHTCGSF